MRNPPKGVTSPRQEWLKAVSKIEAPDSNTLKITLQYVSASFADNLADGRMVVIPKHIFEAKGSMKRDIVGTGPYRFKSFVSGASFEAVRNPDYFLKNRPYLDGITWYIIPDTATRFAALRTHRVQVTPPNIYGLTPSQSELVRRDLSDKIIVHRFSGLAFRAFWMPHTKPPWNDVRVRRAVDIAIDRPKVIKVGMEGAADIGGFMPPGAWSLPEAELMNIPGYRQPKDPDIAEAKRLMAEAGYGSGLKTTMLAAIGVTKETQAVMAKDNLAKIGIDAALIMVDQTDLYDRAGRHAFDLCAATRQDNANDPNEVLYTYYATGAEGNWGVFSDGAIDALIDKQAGIMDKAAREPVLAEIEKRLFDQVPMAVVFWDILQTGVWKQVRNFHPGPGIHPWGKLDRVWLAE